MGATKRSPKPARIDVLALLSACRRKVATLFVDYQELVECDGLCEERLRLAMQICTFVKMRIALEREILHPMLACGPGAAVPSARQPTRGPES
jgi:hypothetical protein